MQNPDARPLPDGWTQDYNPVYQAWFYIDLKCNPPKSTYQHPVDQPPSHLRSASSPNPPPIGRYANQSTARQVSTPSTVTSPMLNMPQPQAGQPSAQTAYPATMKLPQPAPAPPAYTAPAMPYATTASAQLPTLMTYQTSMPRPKSVVSPIRYAAAPVSQPLYLNTQSSARRKDEFNDFEKVVIKCGKKVGRVGRRACRVAAEIVGARNGAVATGLLTRTAINSASGMSAEDAAVAAFASTARQGPVRAGSNMAQIRAQNGGPQQSIYAQQPTLQGPDIMQMVLAAMAQNSNAHQSKQQDPDIMQILATMFAQNGSARQPAHVQAALQNPDFMRILSNAIAPGQAAPQVPGFAPSLSSAMGQNGLAIQQPTTVQAAPLEPDVIQMLSNAMAQSSLAAQQDPDFMQVLSNAVAQSIPSAQQQQQQRQQTLAFLSSMSGAPQKTFATDMWAGDTSAAYPEQMQQYQQEEFQQEEFVFQQEEPVFQQEEPVFQQEESVFAAEEYYEADTCFDSTE